MISLLNLIYSDIIYLWNQAKIFVLQELEFRCVSWSEI